MRSHKILILIALSLTITVGCSKPEVEDLSYRVNLLTNPTWESDSLLVNGEDAGGEGQLLEMFKGDAKFYTDGTGYFGSFTGTWYFAQNYNELVVYSESIGYLATKIEVLTEDEMKITTIFPDYSNPELNLNIRMTFNAK